MSTVTKKRANEVADAIEPSVKVLLLATVFAEYERERVDVIQRRVLAEQCYYGRVPMRGGEYGAQYRVTDPRDFHMDEGSSKAYHAKLQAIHLAEGFADAAKGYCPALVAEHNKIQAEWALLEVAEPFFPGVTNNALLCAGMEKRKQFIDLLIGLVVNRPTFKMGLPSA